MKSKLFVNRIKHVFYRFVWPKKFLIADADKYGLKFKFSIRDGIGTDIYYKWGVYSEDYITQYILNEIGIHDGDLILDIGANIGWYSLVLSYSAKPQVFAFEPEPNNFKLLSENVAMNHRDNITVVNAAVDNKEGIMQLHLYKDYNQGRHSFIKHEKSKVTVDVKTIVLDKFLRENGVSEKKIKFLKIDIEGYEFTALRGASHALTLTENVLSEFSPGIMEQINEDAMKYVEYMNGFGFRAFEMSPAGLHPADFNKLVQNKEGVYNILWRK